MADQLSTNINACRSENIFEKYFSYSSYPPKDHSPGHDIDPGSSYGFMWIEK
jgi:hypothetical protein